MTSGEQGVSASRAAWRADVRRGVVGCLTFVGAFTLCLIVSTVVAVCATSALARDEVPGALYADGLFVRWWCGGAVVSLGAATLAGAVCGRWVGGGRTERSEAPDRGA